MLLWSDILCEKLEGKKPGFPQIERKYFLESVRYVSQVIVIDHLANRDELPQINGMDPGIWAILEREDNPNKHNYC